MIAGIGVDTASAARLAKSMRSDSFRRHFFGARERAELEARNLPAEGAAAVFAAKEAFGKALGEGLAGFAWPEVQVLHLSSGAPYLYFEGAAAERMRREGLRAHLSLTHEGGFATAFVVLEKLQDTPEVHFV